MFKALVVSAAFTAIAPGLAFAENQPPCRRSFMLVSKLAVLLTQTELTKGLRVHGTTWN